MAKALDLIGRRFGRLTVIRRAENSKHGNTRWDCVCDCGNTKTIVSGMLSVGDAVSCGCKKAEWLQTIAKASFIDITGQVFSRLTVIKLVGKNNSGRYMWECLCTCGKLKEVDAKNLKSGNTTSCRCAWTEQLIRRNTTRGLSHTPEYRSKLRREERLRNKDNVIWQLRNRISGNIRSAIAARGYRKKSKTSQILGCTFDEFRVHIEKQFTGNMSWENFHLIDLDHIIPMATAENEADVLRLSHYSNFQPLWAETNRDKSDKIGYVVGSTEPENGISFRKIRAQAKLAAIQPLPQPENTA